MALKPGDFVGHLHPSSVSGCCGWVLSINGFSLRVSIMVPDMGSDMGLDSVTRDTDGVFKALATFAGLVPRVETR